MITSISVELWSLLRVNVEHSGVCSLSLVSPWILGFLLSLPTFSDVEFALVVRTFLVCSFSVYDVSTTPASRSFFVDVCADYFFYVDSFTVVVTVRLILLQ